MWRAPRGGTVGATMSTPAAAVLNRPARARAWREVAIDVTLTAVRSGKCDTNAPKPPASMG